MKELVAKAVDDFVCANPEYRKIYKLPRQFLQLNLIISSFVLGIIHDKVWQGLSGCFATEDAALRSQSLSLAPMSPVNDMGLRPDLLHTIPDAMEILGRVADCRTPLEMLYRLQDVIDCFSSKADPSKVARPGSASVSSPPRQVVAGDEVLPAFVCSVVRASPDRLHTLCFYMENFVFVDISSTSLGYALATFRAAIEYIRRSYESLPPEQRVANPLTAGSGTLGASRSPIVDDEKSALSTSASVRSIPRQTGSPTSFSSGSVVSSPPSVFVPSSPPSSGMIPRAAPTIGSSSSGAFSVSSPPMMQAPPVTANPAPLPGATVRTFARAPDIIRAPGSPKDERRLGAFLAKLRSARGTVSSSELK